jgi:hypothetical protein
MDQAHTPAITNRLFWDIDPTQLDVNADRLLVMERVLSRGTWPDFLGLLRFYGKDTIRQEIVKATYLPADVLNFVCFYFDLTKADFVCYSQRQSHRELWSY